MALSINDLGTVQEELYDIRAKSYDIGLQLKVPVGTLDSIASQFVKPSDKLRETLKAWLKMATQQEWQTIVEMLKSRTIGESKLAGDIETKYCQGSLGEASGQALPRDTLIQNPQLQLQTKDTQVQQELTQLKQQVQEIKLAVEQGALNPTEREMRLKKLIWRKCPKVPEAMRRGSAATDGTNAYFNSWGSTKVHQYHSYSEQWSQLPDLPHAESTLVVADSKLTSVGGYTRGRAYDTLFSLVEEGKERKWLQHLPPMCNKRFFAAAVCNGRFLIVAGGNDERNELTTVEVLNLDSQQWSAACSLPHPIDETTTSICGGRLYMVGGFDATTFDTRSVLTCSIPELLHSCQTPSMSTIWQWVADAPYRKSSGVTLCGRLVAVGGIDEAGKETKSVSAYDEKTDSWQAMEAMTTPRSSALVASLHDNTMIVIGGWAGGNFAPVEIANGL